MRQTVERTRQTVERMRQTVERIRQTGERMRQTGERIAKGTGRIAKGIPRMGRLSEGIRPRHGRARRAWGGLAMFTGRLKPDAHSAAAHAAAEARGWGRKHGAGALSI